MSARTIAEELGAHPSLQGVDSSGIEELAARVKVREHAVAETIIRAGDDPDEIFFLLTGSVQVQVPGSHIATLEAGAIFGEASLFEGDHFLPPGWRIHKRTATVVAASSVRLAAVHVDDLSLLLRKYPAVRKAIGDLGAARLKG